MTDGFSLYDDCVMVQLSDEVFANCEQFTCGNADLDDFFVSLFTHYPMTVLRRLIWKEPQEIGLAERLGIGSVGEVILQH